MAHDMRTMSKHGMPDPVFDIISDDEFERGFLNIISHGYKDNTYKFALARFLLDYSNEHDDTHVRLSAIKETDKHGGSNTVLHEWSHNQSWLEHVHRAVWQHAGVMHD